MTIYSQIGNNKVKTYLIMVLFVAFITTVVYVFGQASGYGASFGLMALAFSLLMSVGSYYFSDSIVLAISGAKEMKNTPGQDVFDIVQNLSMADGLPMPKIYLIDDPAPNAFATGRDPAHATVCVTSGLLQLMNKAELEGVIAHELSHVKNFDTRLMAVVSVLVGSVALLGNWFLRSMWWGGRNSDDEDNKSSSIFFVLGIVFAILSPVIATLIQLAISRRREFLADSSGALLTRYPEGLARALQKLENSQRPNSRFANNATAHLFIVNPFAPAQGKPSGKKARSWLAGLFDTHPPLEERIKILRSL